MTTTTTTTTPFDVGGTLAFLERGNYERVALQLPNEFLPHARFLCETLGAGEAKRVVFVLGDSSYSECCVDEVAALRYGADCIVHYGRSCFSRPSRLPVYLVFGEREWELTPDAIDSILDMASPSNSPAMLDDKDDDGTEKSKIRNETSSSRVVLVISDARVSLDSVRRLKTMLGNYSNATVVFAEDPPRVLMPITSSSSSSSQTDETAKDFRPPETPQGEQDRDEEEETILGRRILFSTLSSSSSSSSKPHNKVTPSSILYIGDANFFPLTQLSLKYRDVSIFDVVENKRLSHEFNLSRTLGRRYHFIEKTKNAKIIGIVVGTMSVSGYFEAVQRTRALIARAGKKSYTFLVGKLNPAKLANFTEIDVFVMISCPQSTLIEDAKKEFFKPVVTPYELKLALSRATREEQQQDEEIGQGEGSHADLGVGDTLVSTSTSTVTPASYEFDFNRVLNDVPRFSPTLEHASNTTKSTALARSRRGQPESGKIILQYSSPYADAMALKAFKGLERSSAQATPAPAIPGRSGVAWAYEGEGS